MRPPLGPRRSERGSVTAELALGLVAVAVVLLVAGSLAAAGTVQVRAQLTAGAAARALARGEAPEVVEARAVEVLGPGSRLERTTSAGLVSVRVVVPVTVTGLGPEVLLSGSAVSPEEVP